MYKKILVPLDHSFADETIIQHMIDLQRDMHSEILLFHVADGWAARQYKNLELKESEEVHRDKKYLESVAERLRAKAIKVSTHLSMGEPANEIIRFAKEHQCDLIAMATHGHRFFSDFFLGTTATKVRHVVDIPVLFLKAAKK